MDPVRSWPGFGLVCLSTNLATFRIRHMPSVQCPPLLHPHTIARPSYTPTPLPAPPTPPQLCPPLLHPHTFARPSYTPTPLPAPPTPPHLCPPLQARGQQLVQVQVLGQEAWRPHQLEPGLRPCLRMLLHLCLRLRLCPHGARPACLNLHRV